MALLRLTNRHGTSALLSTFGARLVELLAPDRDGALGNIVLGHDTEQQYRADPGPYFGATVGRVAGRVADAHFIGGGLEFDLQPNEGSTHLHGGPSRALDRVEWRIGEAPDGASAVFHYASPDGEEGYPGTLDVTCSYRLTDDNELELEITAETDAATPVNIVNHTYFNLSGDARESIVDHELMIDASAILAADKRLLPVGGVLKVAGTPYDFRLARRIGDDLPAGSGEPWPGIDSTYVLDQSARPAATLWDPPSGRHLEIRTTEPTLQVYTGNRIEPVAGRSSAPHGAGKGICLEAHRVPDSPTLPDWPSIVIQPGERYAQRTVWRLGAR
ncbi:aldose epimerase family protein [Cryobacterium ruanii]|uniref:Aldose 1-epimerase n=1 Tax=Cryobacterium ruanii TaxID=1259197 RepID=A0A4R9AK35_9MICO|nr:aldose epimerase family protein [Cryobacterium ruanii]TFD63541.1 galactose mutarotase [Cryobacterium ruanii]